MSTAGGFTFAPPAALGYAFVGVAVFAAIGALSHQRGRAFSSSVVYLLLGAGAAMAIDALGLDWVTPAGDADLLLHLSEFAVVIALFGAGLRIDRRPSTRTWGSVTRLLVVVMPLTILALAAFGHGVLGLSLGAAIVLAGILAPTDPVLAGDLGVGPPGERNEPEPGFALTAEAGLNDGLAFPVVLLGLALVASGGGPEGLLEWAVADVAWAIGVGVGVGATLGYLIAALSVRLRDRGLLAPELDGWAAVGTVLVVYGACEALSAYGFVGAFVGGLAFRSYERRHDFHEQVHHGAELVERWSELGLILLLGSMLTLSGLASVGVWGWVLVALLLVVRPLATALAFTGSRLAARERLFVGWFGVRGVGSLYYLAVVLVAASLDPGAEDRITWIVIAGVAASILLHGVSADPLRRRLLGVVPERPGDEGDEGISRPPPSGGAAHPDRTTTEAAHRFSRGEAEGAHERA